MGKNLSLLCKAEGRVPIKRSVAMTVPVSAAYRVIDLDQENYQYAMVTSGRMSYFWILSRSPELDAAQLQQLLAKATDHGFDLTRLIIVDQTPMSSWVTRRSLLKSEACVHSWAES